VHLQRIEARRLQRSLARLLPIALSFALSSCGQTPPQTPPAAELPTGRALALQLSSEAFAPGEPIPPEYTCDDDDVSPPLSWTHPPEGTVSLALICDDPDAPLTTWVHWVLYDIPATVLALPSGIESTPFPSGGGVHGENSWRNLGYGGPCPPAGTHRYYFRLYALDAPLNLNPGATKRDVLKAMEGHIVGQAELMGTYTRE